MKQLDPVNNFAITKNVNQQNAGDTTVEVDDLSVLPDPGTDGAFNMVWYNSTGYEKPSNDPKVEIVRVTDQDTNNSTVDLGRGKEGTTATDKYKDSTLILAPTAKTIQDIDAILDNIDDDGDGIVDAADELKDGSNSVTAQQARDHIDATDNPHSVTKSQVGLGNVTNDKQAKSADIDAANGIAPLNANKKIPSANLPPLAISETYVVASETDQLNLDTEEGDIVKRTDQNTTYIHNGGTAGDMTDFTEISADAPVDSVNGQTGTVSLTSDDIDDSNDSHKFVTDAQRTKLNNIESNANLYEDEDAQDAIGNILGSGITYDDATPSITLTNDTVTVAGNSVSLGGSTAINHSDLSSVNTDDHHAKYTDEEAQDAIGTIADGTIAYDDTAPSFGVADNSIGTTQLSFDPATQTELNNHASTADAHHAKTTSAGNAGAVQYSDGSGGFNGNDSNLYVDDSTGNVGIGTSSPNFRTHITPQSGSVGLKVDSNGQGDAEEVRIGSGNDAIRLVGGNNGTIAFGGSDGETISNLSRFTRFSGDMFFDNEDGGDILFRTNGDNGFTLKNNNDAVFDANVGIGTTNPGSKLEVSGGNVSIVNDNQGYTIDGGRVEFKAVNTQAVINAPSNKNVRLQTGGNDRFFVQGGGSIFMATNGSNVGIGVSSPNSTLHNAGAYTQEPLSSDPADPDPGHSVQWVSDGNGSGDAGDVMMKINVGGTVKVVTVVDYSAS